MSSVWDVSFIGFIWLCPSSLAACHSVFLLGWLDSLKAAFIGRCFMVLNSPTSWALPLQHSTVLSQLHATASEGFMAVTSALHLSGFGGSLKLQGMNPRSPHSCVFHASKASSKWKTLPSLTFPLRWTLNPLNHICNSLCMLLYS